MRRKRSEPKSHWQVEKERKQSKSILVIINYSCFFHPPVEARTLGNPLGGVSGPPAGFRMADFQASTEQPGGRAGCRSPGRCGMAESTSQPQGMSVSGRTGPAGDR